MVYNANVVNREERRNIMKCVCRLSAEDAVRVLGAAVILCSAALQRVVAAQGVAGGRTLATLKTARNMLESKSYAANLLVFHVCQSWLMAFVIGECRRQPLARVGVGYLRNWSP